MGLGSVLGRLMGGREERRKGGVMRGYGARRWGYGGVWRSGKGGWGLARERALMVDGVVQG